MELLFEFFFDEDGFDPVFFVGVVVCVECLALGVAKVVCALEVARVQFCEVDFECSGSGGRVVGRVVDNLFAGVWVDDEFFKVFIVRV